MNSISASLCVCFHPLIEHRVTVLRDMRTTPLEFRRTVKEITNCLAYEATKLIELEGTSVTTPLSTIYNGQRISDKVAIIPILRAGAIMSDVMCDLLPTAAVHHLGIYHSKSSSLPVVYFNRLPKESKCDIAYICDVSVTSSCSVLAAISIVKEWGAKRIVVMTVIGTEIAMDEILRKHPDVHVVVGAVDKQVSPDGYPLYGIGDTSDRLYGAPMDDDESFLSVVPPRSEMAESPTKRCKIE